MGHLEIARLVLDRGSTAIDEKTPEGNTPLHYACHGGYLEIVSLLLDRGSTVIDEKDDEDNTPLLTATTTDNLEMVRLLLDRGSTAIDEKSIGAGYAPLHYACRDGQLKIARLLLDRGSTAIDEENEFGETPLQIACDHVQLECAKLLLDRGCAFNVESFREGYCKPVFQFIKKYRAQKWKPQRGSAHPDSRKYSRYIHKLAKVQFKERKQQITAKGMRIVNAFVSDVLERLGEEAGRVTSFSGAKTLSVRSVVAAVKLQLPEELATHALAAGTAAVGRYAKACGGRR